MGCVTGCLWIVTMIIAREREREREREKEREREIETNGVRKSESDRQGERYKL